MIFYNVLLLTVCKYRGVSEYVCQKSINAFEGNSNCVYPTHLQVHMKRRHWHTSWASRRWWEKSKGMKRSPRPNQESFAWDLEKGAAVRRYSTTQVTTPGSGSHISDFSTSNWSRFLYIHQYKPGSFTLQEIYIFFLIKWPHSYSSVNSMLEGYHFWKKWGGGRGRTTILFQKP